LTGVQFWLGMLQNDRHKNETRNSLPGSENASRPCAIQINQCMKKNNSKTTK